MYNLLGGSRSCQVGLARVILKVTVTGHARQAGPPHLTVWQRLRTAASLPAHKFIAGVTLEQHGIGPALLAHGANPPCGRNCNRIDAGPSAPYVPMEAHWTDEKRII